MRDIATDASNRAIVCTIITMAQSLNLDVIAEGVELETSNDVSRRFWVPSFSRVFIQQTFAD